MTLISGGSMDFKIRGRGSGTVEFLKSGDCFDAPSHRPYVQTIERSWIVVESRRILSFTMSSHCQHLVGGYCRFPIKHEELISV